MRVKCSLLQAKQTHHAVPAAVRSIHLLRARPPQQREPPAAAARLAQDAVEHLQRQR